MATQRDKIFGHIKRLVLLLTPILFFVIACGEYSKQKKEVQAFAKVSGDTVKYNFNLTMEWAIRTDELRITNGNIEGVISEKIEGIDSAFTKTTLEKRPFQAQVLDTLLQNNKHRVEVKDHAHYLLRKINNGDTLTLYSYNLADRGRFIQEYFTVMKSLYPQSDKFEYPKD